MTAAACSEPDFIHLFETTGAAATAKHLNIPVRNVYTRRDRIERRLGRQLRSPGPGTTRHAAPHPQRAQIEVENGHVIIGSDAHYWPGAASTAHRGLIKFCKELKPKAVIKNGDSLDGAKISRHPPINWEARPDVIQEIEAVKERHGEIEDAAPKAALTWNLGNHDARFETRLATVAAEYARIHGFHLKDHFSPRWRSAWATWINSDVVVKHRWKGGVHATHNNAAGSGMTMITGHLHSAKVTPYDDYKGRRYGVDTGCIADPWGPQFEYMEDNPRNWRAGFCVLTFHKGVLLQPQLALVHDPNHIDFCGMLVRV